jgi:hypothetical protein
MSYRVLGRSPQGVGPMKYGEAFIKRSTASPALLLHCIGLLLAPAQTLPSSVAASGRSGAAVAG